MLNKSPCGSHVAPIYNVLVLGETQSGKSTLIQCMREYANTSADIDITALGTGILSHTQEVNTTPIITNLPEYNVVDKSGVNINYSKFIKMHDRNDFEDALNMRHGLKTIKGRPHLHTSAKFNIIDTPGLNSTGSDDEQNVQSIFNALNRVTTIHLILITISLGPFTLGLKDSIRTYVSMFPGFGGTIALVSTHFDYKYFHPARAHVSHAIDNRTECLRGIMDRKTFSSFKIDCNLNSKRPIRNCITHNTILRILELATLSPPVHVQQSVVSKTRKMRDIDNILRPRLESAIASIERTRWLQDPDEGEELLAEIFLCDTRIHKLNAKIKVLEVPLLEIQNKERIDMEHVVIDQERATEICHQVTRVQHLPIHGDLLHYQMQVAGECGRSGDGGPQRSWQPDLRPACTVHCHHQVKIYTTKLKKYRDDIEKKRREYWELQRKMERAIQHREENPLYREKWPQGVMDAIDDHAEKLQVLEFLENEFLLPEVFKALMDAEVYIGGTAQCVERVQKVYTRLARKDLSASTMTIEV